MALVQQEDAFFGVAVPRAKKNAPVTWTGARMMSSNQLQWLSEVARPQLPKLGQNPLSVYDVRGLILRPLSQRIEAVSLQRAATFTGGLENQPRQLFSFNNRNSPQFVILFDGLQHQLAETLFEFSGQVGYRLRPRLPVGLNKDASPCKNSTSDDAPVFERDPIEYNNLGNASKRAQHAVKAILKRGVQIIFSLLLILRTHRA